MTGPDHALRIVRSASLASLADHLADHLVAAPPVDPFSRVEVVVPSRGVERWLAQRLSRRLGATPEQAGVCANLGFPFLGGVVERVLAATLGGPSDVTDPWSPSRLAWPVLAALDDLPPTLEFAPLRLHLTQDGAPAPRRRFPLARRIADLFDRYALYRPDMVAAWRRGEDVDGNGVALAANLAWQPPLWRQLSAALPIDSPDRRTADAIRGLQRGEVASPEELPGSVTVFGLLSLPPRQLELLAALSQQVPVTLYTLSPCPAWRAVDHDPRPQQPLLVASGTVAREAHTVLAPLLDDAVQLAAPRDAVSPATALEVLQHDVRHDRRRGAGGTAPAIEVPAGDDSIQVHACHGPLRQLEVVREVLLGLLDDDPTLEPRDIVVLTPDLEAYAPIVPAAFPRRGSGAAADDPLDLPVVVADPAGQEDGVAAALLALLELVTARVTASQVLDLLSTSPVRARFALDEADLDELQRWLLDTGVSWGIDADHRQELIEVGDDAHTWAAALDRWTLGAAMADDGTRLVGDVRPYDDVEGGGVELLGRVTDATEAVFAALRTLAAPRGIGSWRDALVEVLTQVFDPGPGPARDAALAAELAHVRGLLDELVTDAGAAGGAADAVPLSLEEVRGMLEGSLTAGTRAAATGTGAITVTGLVPLRSVPHRVVCLVGMDDGAVPRAGTRHGFDLLEAPSRPGDPDPRQEERQLLLDAVLSATDHLIITYSGYDPRTNEPLQPAVPVSELLDVLDAAVIGGAPVVRSHPLQPHSPRYFGAATDGAAPVLHAFDRHHLAAARAAVAATGPVPGFLERPLPDPGAVASDPDVVELDDLLRFLEHPVRFLLRQRLGLALGEDDRRLPDRDPTELGPLERWRLGQELLALRLAEVAPEQWRRVTMATGTAPVGGLGEVALAGVEELVEQVARAVEGIDGERRLHTIDLAVPVTDGQRSVIRLVGTVELVGRTVLHAGVSRPKARHRLAAWVRTVGVLASAPQLGPRAVLVGGDRSLKAGVRQLALDPLVGLAADGVDGTPANLPTGAALASADPAALADTAELARAHLGALTSLYLRGHREVLALLPETGSEYGAARLGGADHASAIATAHHRAWVGRGPFGGDRDDAYVVQAFGQETDLAAIDARHPLGAAADLLWRPIVAGEVAP